MLAGTATGLYGHVEENRKRSILLFAGFIVAIELMALVMLLGPTLIYDYRHNPLFSPIGYLTRYVVPVAVVGLLVYAAKLWWFVGAVKKAVGFRYVDNDDEPRFCRILEPLAIAAGIATPYAAVIDTPALNALACGVRANHMVVVATRGLIDGLDDDELAAVLAHEIAHIKNRDTMLLASANTFMATLMFAQSRRPLRLDDWRQSIGLILLPIFIPVVLLLSFITQLALRIGYCSRAAIGSAREYIADAEAVRLTKNPAALVSALRKIEGRSRIDSLGAAEEAMMIDGPVEGPLATHPAVTERIAALARVTGSMIFEGGTRLDTRPAPLANAARVQGFGRRDDQLMQIATLAAAPSRAGLWEIFRKTRDPERNLFGFNRKAAIIYGIMLIAIALIATQPRGRRMFAGELAFIGSAGDLGALTRGVAGCSVKSIANPAALVRDPACNSGQLDRQAERLMTGWGINIMRERREREQSEARTLVQMHLARRCYSGRFNMSPAALTGPPLGNSSNESLDTFIAGASKANDDILLHAQGPARDQALKAYVDFRKLMLDDALYFFGPVGRDAVNQAYRRDDHQQVIALLGRRLRDPGFVMGDEAYTIADLRVFATAPFDALPCSVAAEVDDHAAR